MPTVISGDEAGEAGFVDGAMHDSRLYGPTDCAFSPDGSRLYVTDTMNMAVRWVDMATLETGTLATLTHRPLLMAVAPSGNLYVTTVNVPYDQTATPVLKVTPAGAVSTVCTVVSPTGVAVTDDETMLVMSGNGGDYFGDAWAAQMLTVSLPSGTPTLRWQGSIFIGMTGVAAVGDGTYLVCSGNGYNDAGDGIYVFDPRPASATMTRVYSKQANSAGRSHAVTIRPVGGDTYLVGWVVGAQMGRWDGVTWTWDTDRRWDWTTRLQGCAWDGIRPVACASPHDIDTKGDWVGFSATVGNHLVRFDAGGHVSHRVIWFT